jgi:X-X-X-Leu-X-X-Gly heptad repeat protein
MAHVSGGVAQVSAGVAQVSGGVAQHWKYGFDKWRGGSRRRLKLNSVAGVV